MSPRLPRAGEPWLLHPSPLRLPCSIPCTVVSYRRQKSGATLKVPKPLHNVCCSYIPLHLWNVLFKHSLGQVFWCINQTHKLCLKPLCCLTTSRERGWHVTRKAMKNDTKDDLVVSLKAAQTLSEMLPSLRQRERICPGLTKAKQFHVQPSPSPIPTLLWAHYGQVSSCPVTKRCP